MQLFLFLNDLAGRWPWLDELFRFIYIGTIPLLGTLLLARLTLLPKAPHDPSRSRVVIATVLAVALCVLTMLAINGLASVLHLGVLSPRPFMTRRINLLIVEPQDNSFPSPELMVAAAFAVALAALGKRWAITGGILTVLLGITRMYCGNNYLVDVVAGGFIGAGLAGLAFSLVHAPLRNLTRTLQMSWSSALLGATFLSIYLGLTFQPRFASKLYAPWASPATAAPTSASAKTASKSTRDAQSALQEGEGVTEGEDAEHEAEVLALSKRSTLFLPQVEAFLRGRLTPRAHPFTLLDVEVAPVKAGSSAYRCAAVRFEIERNTPNLRRQVAECAARMVKLCFLLDSQMQNVDVVAILRGDGKEIDGSDANFVGDEVPVFTASVQRKNLYLKSPAWANLPYLDGGSWLRLRSRVFINDTVLKESPGHSTEPLPQPPGQHLPQPTATRPPVALPVPPRLPVQPLATATATAIATAKPTPTATPKPTVFPTPTATPVTPQPTVTLPPTATPKPTLKPTATSQPSPTSTSTPHKTLAPAQTGQLLYRPRITAPRYRRKPVYRIPPKRKPVRSKRYRRRYR